MDDSRSVAARNAVLGATCTRRDLARHSGLSYAALRAWATGRRRPEPKSMLRLADALDAYTRRLEELSRALRNAAM